MYHYGCGIREGVQEILQQRFDITIIICRRLKQDWYEIDTFKIQR